MTDDKIAEIFMNYFYNSLNEEKKEKAKNKKSIKDKKSKKPRVIARGAYDENVVAFRANKANTLEGSKKLIKDFNISSNSLLKSDAADLDKAINIIEQAINNDKDMKNIFSISDNVILSNIDRSNAVKIIEILLKAAINTNILQLNSNLKFESMPSEEEELPILINLQSLWKGAFIEWKSIDRAIWKIY